jgi:DNA polymerase Ligase (LigD)
MPRFVILEHDHPQRHWDLMLEAGKVLRTWRLCAPLAAGTVPAEASFDHRLLYLEYEGPISGNRGTVVRWETGTFVWIVATADRVVVELKGSTLVGRLQLDRGTGTNWGGTFTSG